MHTVLLIHVAATWAMVGLIWFVQLVHYPLFAAVGPVDFIDYESQHTRRTTWVVALFMPLEAVTAVWLLAEVPEGVNAALVAVGLVLVAALWLSTATWQAPMHGRLSDGFDSSLQRRLVLSNWVRTSLWTVRGVLVLFLVGQALSQRGAP